MVATEIGVAPSAAAAICAEDMTCEVAGITDGTTTRVMHDGVPERIRVWGVDCPESKEAFAR